ncbi:MAG TPA: hypothetical protein VGL97_18795 [Bryobacteraceae bacterium]
MSRLDVLELPWFNIDVNFTDGLTHQIALYLLDWDTAGRAETIGILDASNNNTLDSRHASASRTASTSYGTSRVM